MKKIAQKILGVLGVSLAMGCQAAAPLEPGKVATPEQLAQWGELPSYDIGSSRLRVIPERPANGQGTLLLNAQGMVGVSRNEVVVANASEDQVRAAAGHAAHAPESVRHFDPTGTTVLRYADFAQAIAGLDAIKAGLPGASVRLPVQFGKPTPF